MSKLLSTEFYKLRKKFVAILVITIAFAVAGAFASISATGTVYVGMNIFFSMFGLIFCGMTGVFISQDFANSTIRNKLIIGHTRFNIYLSYQIAFAVLAFLMTAVFIGSYILLGKLFSGVELFQAEQPAPDVLKVYRENFFKAFPVYLVAVPAYTTLGVFISITLKNSLGGVVTVIIVYELNSLPLLDAIFPENKFVAFINIVLPPSQLFLMEKLSAGSDFSPLKYILFSMIFAIVMIMLGYAIFRKADLK